VSDADEVAEVRRRAGLFRLADRGLLAVTGSDRVRWLDGMLSNDVRVLEPGPARSGCHAVLLTAKGRVVADLHVLAREEAFWLETGASALVATTDTLERHVIADDVAIVDLSDSLERLAVEGPRAREALEGAAARRIELALGSWEQLELAGAPVVVARFGFTGEEGYQLFAPIEHGQAVADALRAANPDLGEVGSRAREILRVEAGIPALGSELDESVLPAEANLTDAVSLTKGCYVGQEVVARMHSRGRVSHRLVGLKLLGGPGPGLPEPGTQLEAAGKKVGELTSVCDSPTFGAIGLGFVRAAHAAGGAELTAGEWPVRVCGLPFWE
jgi:folate-binding protein YgfZ